MPMKLMIRKRLFAFLWGLFLFWGAFSGQAVNAQWGNFSQGLSQGVESIREHLDTPDTSILMKSKAAAIIKKVVDVLFPVILIAGVLIAMIGLYQVLVSGDAAKVKEWSTMMFYGVIGIIIMFSAKYLTTVIFSDIFLGGVGEAMTTTDWINKLYNNIVFPFIKIAIYLSLGFLVIMMMIRVFTYITAQDDGTKKKALGVITWTTIGMLFIIAAKQIVEAVYGKQETVLKTWVQNLSGIGTQILNPKEIPILFTVINRSLALVSLVLLVMIILQTYKMLTKPDDAATFWSLKKTIIYALWGLLLIGSAYLLSNLFILN